MEVPYLSPEDLEFAALDVLSSFERKEVAILVPPVPIEQIIEAHMGLTIQFDKLDRQVLGCLSVKDKIITINESLDTYNYPQKEGRYNFTLAHEAAHEILHAPDLRRRIEHPNLFGEISNESPTILCRKDNQQDFIEYQANFTGAALLMPKRLMHQFWTKRFGDLRQVDATAVLHKVRRDDEFVSKVDRMRGASDEAILEEHFRPIAEDFRASPEAFCRRLRTLGLLGQQNNRELFARTSV